jgi:hypothetical protein
VLALDRRSRAAIAGGGLLAFAVAFASMPILAGGHEAVVAPTPRGPVATAPPTPQAVVAPQRDPFAGGPPDAKTASRPSQAAVPVPPLPPIPATIGPLPANDGAAGEPPLQTTPRVTALVAGAHPYALVDENGRTRIVAPGDRLGGDRVVAIDVTGVHLAHATLPLAPRPLVRTQSVAPQPPPIPRTGDPQ